MGGRGGASHISARAAGGLSKELPLSLEKQVEFEKAWRARMISELASPGDAAYIAEQIRRVISSNDFGMNIKPEYIRNVMAEGFKNQFQTGGRSEGAEFDPNDLSPRNGRVLAAVNMFGLDYKRMKGAYYEKYGSLLPKDILQAARESPSSYGSALIRFKREAVEKRTTYTLHDSLGPATEGEIIAGRISNPSFAGLSTNELATAAAKMHAAAHHAGNAQKWVESVTEGAYFELQYHGKLDFHDVSSVTFIHRPDMGLVRDIHRQFPSVKIYDVSGGSVIEI